MAPGLTVVLPVADDDYASSVTIASRDTIISMHKHHTAGR